MRLTPFLALAAIVGIFGFTTARWLTVHAISGMDNGGRAFVEAIDMEQIARDGYSGAREE